MEPCEVVQTPFCSYLKPRFPNENPVLTSLNPVHLDECVDSELILKDLKPIYVCTFETLFLDRLAAHCLVS